MGNISSSDSAEHDADEGEIEPGLGVVGFDFVMPDQAALFHKPAEGALDDPAFGQDYEVFEFVPTNDVHLQRAGFALRGQGQ